MQKTNIKNNIIVTSTPYVPIQRDLKSRSKTNTHYSSKMHAFNICDDKFYPQDVNKTVKLSKSQNRPFTTVRLLDNIKIRHECKSEINLQTSPSKSTNETSIYNTYNNRNDNNVTTNK